MINFKEDWCVGLSDQEVIHMALENMEYFACLILKYETRLIHYIKKISQCEQEESEDILQEAFIKIWKNLHGYDPRLSLESWIFRIVHNETISYWRKKTSFAKDHLINIDDERLSKLVAYDDKDIEESEKLYAIIEEILPLLKQEYREDLVLKYLEGKQYDEISDILKIPEGTVATRINRAKKSFRQLAVGKFDNSIFK